MIHLRNTHQISLLREAGRITAGCMEIVSSLIRPGVTTGELNVAAEAFIRKNNATPTFLGYGGFPATICTSVNEAVVHGIPGDRVIIEGDIISIDLGATYKGFVGDMARTFPVGEISQEAADLILITKECFERGFAMMRVGNYLTDISRAVQEHAEAHGYGVVRDLCGHGVGTKMHEEPSLPNYVDSRSNVKLKHGMVLALEPMINLGTWEVDFLQDGWTTLTRDRKLSAHYENTVAVTDDGPIILTAL
ncbi:MAG: type I methionyl aminopeptidase [Christensenellales bacterium]|jgi:methionyl aminopeptidase